MLDDVMELMVKILPDYMIKGNVTGSNVKIITDAIISTVLEYHKDPVNFVNKFGDRLEKDRTVGLDFDGTVVEHKYPHIGDDIGAVPWLKRWSNHGIRIVLNTMRSDQYLDDAVRWFKDNGIPLYGVNNNPTQNTWTNSPKAFANCYVDDLAFGTPLVRNSDRPYVDWSVVGPGVLKFFGVTEW